MKTLISREKIQFFEKIYPDANIVIWRDNRIEFTNCGNEFILSPPVKYDIFSSVVINDNKFSRFHYQLDTNTVIDVFFYAETKFNIKDVLESLFEIKSLQKISYSFQSNRTLKYNYLMHQILLKYVEQNRSFLTDLAASWDIDFSLPRVVCLISLYRTEASEHPINTESICTMLFNSMHVDSEDLLYAENQNNIIMLKRIIPGDSVKIQTERYLSTIAERLKQTYAPLVKIYVGPMVSDMSQYHSAYRITRSMISAIKTDSAINYLSDNTISLMLDHFSTDLMEHYFSYFINRLQTDPELFDILEALVLNDMNILKASRAENMHRNTMLNHTHKLIEALGLDPINKENDRYTLCIFYYYYKYYR